VWQPSATVIGRHICIGLLIALLLATASTAKARELSGRQVHVVYEGQRLGSIAKRYNVSIEAICEANGIRRRDPIRPGQRLEIPSREESKKSLVSASAVPASQLDVTRTGALPPVAAKSTPLDAASRKSSLSLPPDLRKTEELATRANTKTPVSTAAQPSSPTSPTLAKIASAPTEPEVFTVDVPSAGMSHRVQTGESLSAIAVRYDTNVKSLLQVNNLRRDQVIRVGQVLKLPKAAVPPTWWGRFARAPRQAGEIEVFAHTHRWKGKVVVNGKVLPKARAALSGLLGATGSAPPVPDRLIQLLSHVSDVFGGRPIRLVSGYRTNSYVKDSRHRHSLAVDFSIPGVPNSAVRDYLLQLRNVGVGYYPNSTFVHLDVRARPAYWVDYAGPGEAPRKKPRAERRVASTTGKAQRNAGAPTRLRRTASSSSYGSRI
jgi:LysM repeat protein